MEDFVTKELERVYLKVVERFPEIRKEEIKLEYSMLFEYASFVMVDEKKFFEEDKIVIDPKITAGPKFLDFSEEEKEASIAHELGHYICYKNASSIKKVTQRITRIIMINEYAYDPIIWMMEELNYKVKHKTSRLKKWFYMNELYADNKALEAGYGHALLEILKKHITKYSGILAPVHKDELTMRIKNLEEKILKL